MSSRNQFSLFSFFLELDGICNLEGCVSRGKEVMGGGVESSKFYDF